jgi:hypothetical protein
MSRELGCPHPEERACASAPAKSSDRARVSKDEDSTTSPSCFETHRSTRRLWKRLRLRGAAMLLSMRATVRGGFWRNEPNEHFGQTKPSREHARERRTNLRLCEIGPDGISLFRVVIYNEVCNPHVPARLSAEDLPACCGCHHWSSIHPAQRFAIVSTGLCWCVSQTTRGGRVQRCFCATAVRVRSAPTVSCDQSLRRWWHARFKRTMR